VTTTVTVSPRAGGGFDVEVSHRGALTRYAVRVPETLAAELGRPGVADERLVEESFRFLLEREPPSSILPSFDLAVIERYFPEYRRELARRLA
jgi:hypothetical protein